MKDESVPVVHDEKFSLIQRKATMMSKSDLVPEIYRGGGEKAVANCIIAMQMAHRIGADELMVMQNLHIIKGKPGWSSTFIISAINACGRFSPLRYKKTGEGMTATCMARAVEKATGETLEGPTVSMKMAEAEGWLSKSGSKWKTMPELMLMYRAASFFGRLYAPDILLGMHTAEELPDMTPDAPVSLEDGVVVIEEVDGEVVIEDVPAEESVCGACGEVSDNLLKQENDDILCQGCIDVCSMNEGVLIDPPTEKDKDNPIDHSDIKIIFAKLHALEIKDALAQHAEVSDILQFKEPVTSFSFLNSMQAGLVIDQLAEREKETGQ